MGWIFSLSLSGALPPTSSSGYPAQLRMYRYRYISVPASTVVMNDCAAFYLQLRFVKPKTFQCAFLCVLLTQIVRSFFPIAFSLAWWSLHPATSLNGGFFVVVAVVVVGGGGGGGRGK